MTFGLVSFGRVLGDRVALADVVGDYTEDTARVLDQGYENVFRCAEGTSVTDLAVEAAEAALAGAGLDAGDIDLLVLAVTDVVDYLYWDAAASVQHRLGAVRAEAVLVDQACAGGITCLDTVAGRLATHPDYQAALVVAANRTCEAYWNRMTTQSLVFSDGAAAAVVRRDHPRLRWRCAETLTDGRLAELFRMDVGGAVAPFEVDTAPKGAIQARDGWHALEFFDYDPDRFTGFIRELDTRTREVVGRACARVGASSRDLTLAIVIHDNDGALRSLLDELGVPVERSNLARSLEFGHLGAADYLFDLGWYADRGRLRPGNLVALAGRGRGMHWACAVLEA